MALNALVHYFATVRKTVGLKALIECKEPHQRIMLLFFRLFSAYIFSFHLCCIRHRIQFNVGLLAFKAQHALLPPYLHNILSSHHLTSQLRSSSVHQFFKPSVNTNFASRAFSVSVPSVWNSLKPNLRSIDSAASFISQLNTTTLSLW